MYSISVSIHLMLQFILLQSMCKMMFMCFNTSHVVVYRQFMCSGLIQSRSFNTSHVVVYPRKQRMILDMLQVSIHLMLQFILFLLLFFYVSSRVSIHLMLQFIEADLSPSSSALEFQYISCCSLSISPRCQDNTRSLFQYISCCSLSRFTELFEANRDKFQYISCIETCLCSLQKVL